MNLKAHMEASVHHPIRCRSFSAMLRRTHRLLFMNKEKMMKIVVLAGEQVQNVLSPLHQEQEYVRHYDRKDIRRFLWIFLRH